MSQIEKPRVFIALGQTTAENLVAARLLSSLKPQASLPEALDRRHPLGIYNLSIGRTCDKVKRCCELLERYSLLSKKLSELRSHPEHAQAVVDYLELCIYAAAEHIDDVELLAGCFFASSNEFAKSPHVRSLKKELKAIRDQISSFANAIKHAQARVRLFTTEFHHGGNDLCLHGFFIEGFRDGAVGPSRVIHSEGQEIFSATSFLWQVVVFLLQSSHQVAKFLSGIDAVSTARTVNSEDMVFSDMVVSLLRLPLYSFDDVHPFSKTTVVLEGAEALSKELRSDLYGSFYQRWTLSHEGGVGGYSALFAGDGVTKTFRIAFPKQLSIQHWQ
ncbi:MAG: hypothetical protein ACRCV9_00925 [Burkholderiaceae bacterium]